MIAVRTSIKTFALGILFFLGFYFTSRAAESYYDRTNPISFGLDFERSWNHWDYIAAGAIVFATASVLVSIWFVRKGD